MLHICNFLALTKYNKNKKKTLILKSLHTDRHETNKKKGFFYSERKREETRKNLPKNTKI